MHGSYYRAIVNSLEDWQWPDIHAVLAPMWSLGSLRRAPEKDPIRLVPIGRATISWEMAGYWLGPNAVVRAPIRPAEVSYHSIELVPT